MKNFWFIAFFTCSVVHLSAQEVVNDPNAEIRKVGKFSSIEVSGTVNLYLSQANESGVAVSAGEEKFNSKIKTVVENGVLVISVDAGMWNTFSWSNKNLKAYVSVKDLDMIEVTGASAIKILGTLTSNSLKLFLSGASELKGNVYVKDLKMEVSGASEARLKGTADNASIEASGAASVSGLELTVDNATVKASGASDVSLTVRQNLSAEASGGSSIRYKGSAAIKKQHTSGASSIKIISDSK